MARLPHSPPDSASAPNHARQALCPTRRSRVPQFSGRPIWPRPSTTPPMPYTPLGDARGIFLKDPSSDDPRKAVAESGEDDRRHEAGEKLKDRVRRQAAKPLRSVLGVLGFHGEPRQNAAGKNIGKALQFFKASSTPRLVAEVRCKTDVAGRRR